MRVLEQLRDPTRGNNGFEHDIDKLHKISVAIVIARPKWREIIGLQGGAKNGAILSHCKYSDNSMTELRGNWWTSAISYAEHSH